MSVSKPSNLPPDLDQSLWTRLVQATSEEEFCQTWLRIQSRMIQGVSAGLVALVRPGTTTFAPVAVWPRDSSDAAALNEVVERVLQERKGVVTRSDGDGPPEEQRVHLAYPVWVGKDLRGSAVLQIAPRPTLELQTAMRQLQWGIAWLQNWFLRGAPTTDGQQAQRVSAVMELTALALQEERFLSAATALVTELATRLRCDRVTLGFLEGRHVKIRALSHSAQFGKNMNLIRAISGAMGESIDQEDILIYPEPEQASSRVLHAHELLARSHGDRAICTVPFARPDGRAFGALTLERSAAEFFDQETVDVCDSLASLAGPILDEKRRNDRFLVLKAWDSLKTQVQKLVGPRHAVYKAVALGLVVLAVFFTFATGRYRVTAKTALQGEIQRVIAAPFRGFIAEAGVRSGDIVKKDQPMCSLDDRDLRVERARVSSEREEHLLEHRKAMAARDVAAMNVLTKKAQQADAQIELLDEEISRTRIAAPFDGIVVSGDLSQALGAPVDAGQILFQVAPLDSYRVVLKVDESDIRQIAVGQTGELVLTALPHETLPIKVSKVTPVSVSEEGRNYFEVEAQLAQAKSRLRPGMEGFGKIDVDRRRLIWIWTHRLVDWVRLRVWSWIP
jgi:RND family efflux transporter MFP subunit